MAIGRTLRLRGAYLNLPYQKRISCIVAGVQGKHTEFLCYRAYIGCRHFSFSGSSDSIASATDEYIRSEKCIHYYLHRAPLWEAFD